MLPEGVEPTRLEVMRVLRSSFFRNANDELSHTINTNAVGLMLAHSFGFEYRGEGIEAFLSGLRDLAKKDEKK
ncbi:hypothetical protein PUMCH_000668 [Australozyma saopauloensis]|uniref:Uncharacterized protein n=1 Tax=Australozyma saopauloensis TaxID=291208 RepID=A0AAX4H4L8_9ASCO|nr:hypothetical protein PUMCH_000668 [[Candida] saopauloensis]